MFKIGFFEIILVIIISLIVIKPSDLPKVLRRIGFWRGKLRNVQWSVQEQLYRYTYSDDSISPEDSDTDRGSGDGKETTDGGTTL